MIKSSGRIAIGCVKYTQQPPQCLTDAESEAFNAFCWLKSRNSGQTDPCSDQIIGKEKKWFPFKAWLRLNLRANMTEDEENKD